MFRRKLEHIVLVKPVYTAFAIKLLNTTYSMQLAQKAADLKDFHDFERET